MEIHRFAVILLCLTSCIELTVCNKYCPYFDSFNRLHHRWCTGECCGSIHQSHCCLEREVGQIVFGSIGGLVFLLAIIVGGIFCCRRFNVCPLRHADDETDRLIPPSRDRSHPPAARKPYGSTTSTVPSSVNVTITPPSPSEKSYRIISRPEPTFTTFQEQPATDVVLTAMGNSQPPPKRTTVIDIEVEPSGDVDVIIDSESEPPIIEPVFQPTVEITSYPDDSCTEEDVIVGPSGDVDVIVETHSDTSSSCSSVSGDVDVVVEPDICIDTYPSQDVDVIVSPSGDVEVIEEPVIDVTSGDVDVIVSPSGDVEVVETPSIDISPYPSAGPYPDADVDVIVNPGMTDITINPTPCPYRDAQPYDQEPAGAYISSYPDTNPYPTSDVGPYGGDPAGAYSPYAGEYVEESGGYGDEVVVTSYSDDDDDY